ncbi:MAG: flagellar export protein FliJ [Bacillota bacterium]
MNEIFSFRLQRVLDYKEHVKNLKSEELARYRVQLDEERDTLNGLQAEKNTMAGTMDEKCSEGVRVEYLAQCNRYMDRLKTFIDKQTENVSEMEKMVEECRNDLTGASKEKEMLDRLRARHYQRFAYHLSKEQEKRLDDLVNNKKVNL